MTFTGEIEGDVPDLTWKIRKVTYSGEPPDWKTIGTGESTEYTFTEIGTYSVRLEGRSSGEFKSTSATTVVLPLLEGVDEPLYFLSFDDDDRSYRLQRMSPGAPSGVTTIEEGLELSANSIDKSPGRDRIVFGVVQGGRARNLQLYDLGGGSLGKELTDTEGISWKAEWSPTGEWIAYVDDTRVEGNSADELALVRPDGSEVVYPSGEAPKEKYFGFHPTWSPDGTTIALGNARFEDEDGSLLKRIAIIRNPWTENPERERLHTEAQIESALESPGQFGYVGGGGMTWSPDGELIAFSGEYTRGIQIGTAKADGSGDINMFPVEGLSYSPTWSPDGKYIVFSRRMDNGNGHLFLVTREGENPIDLSRLRSGGEPVDDISPEWH